MEVNGYKIEPGANLVRADLRGANLRGANLGRADLRGADLGGADLEGANLRGADLRGANLRGAHLWGADLWGADLGRADLRGANLRGAHLWGADLRGAHLWGADLDAHPLTILKSQPGKLHAFKAVSSNRTGPIHPDLVYSQGALLEVRNADTDERVACGAGINVATREWCERSYPGSLILRVEFEAKDIAAIPYASDGKFRLHRCRVVD